MKIENDRDRALGGLLKGLKNAIESAYPEKEIQEWIKVIKKYVEEVVNRTKK